MYRYKELCLLEVEKLDLEKDNNCFSYIDYRYEIHYCI